MSSAAIPAGSLPATRRRVPSAWIARRPKITGEQLPIDVELSPSRLGAMILCVVGLFFLWSSREFLDPIFHAEELLPILVASVFPLIGVGLIAAGLVQLYRRQHVRFGESGVEVSERTLTGSRRWSAAYSDYAGVLQREHTVRRKNHTTTYQIIQLMHADPAYDLPLQVVRGDTAQREAWEALARRLRLPALQLDDDRIVSRPAENLDDSLAEQLRAGHVSAGHGFGPAPDAIEVGQDGSGLSVEFRRNRLQPVAYALFALIPLVFIAIGAGDREQWPSAAFGLAFLAGIGWVGWKDATSPRTLRLTRDEIRSHDAWRWNADTENLKVDDVEGVRIIRSGKLSSRVVLIESDHGTMHLGQGLDRTELAWLRDFLVAEIARRARRDF